MTGDIAQTAEKNKKKNVRVRIDKGSVTSATEDDVTSSSTSTSSAHQQQILAHARARKENQSNNEKSEKLPAKDPGEVRQE
eukprot:12240739-Ditylum_brightwellii.AAC.1